MTSKILSALIESGGMLHKYSPKSSLAKDFALSDMDFQLFLYYLELFYDIEIDEGDIIPTDNLDYVMRYLEFKTLNVA